MFTCTSYKRFYAPASGKTRPRMDYAYTYRLQSAHGKQFQNQTNSKILRDAIMTSFKANSVLSAFLLRDALVQSAVAVLRLHDVCPSVCL